MLYQGLRRKGTRSTHTQERFTRATGVRVDEATRAPVVLVCERVRRA